MKILTSMKDLFPHFLNSKIKKEYEEEQFKISIKYSNCSVLIASAICLFKIIIFLIFSTSKINFTVTWLLWSLYLIQVYLAKRYKKKSDVHSQEVYKFWLHIIGVGNFLSIWTIIMNIEDEVSMGVIIGAGITQNLIHYLLVGRSFQHLMSAYFLALVILIYDYSQGRYSSKTLESIIIFLIMEVLTAICYEAKQREMFINANVVKHESMLYETFMKAVKTPIFIISKNQIQFQNKAAFQEFGVSTLPELLQIFHNLECRTERSKLLLEFMAEASHSRCPNYNNIFEREFIKINEKGENLFSERNKIYETFYRITIIGGSFFPNAGCIGLLARNVTETKLLEKAKVEEEYSNTLICGISHELRTPLNAIMGMIKLAKTDACPPVKNWLRIGYTSCRILLYKINEILDYAQFIAGIFKLHSSIFSIWKMISELRKICQIEKQNKPIDIEYVVEEKIGLIFGDRQRITQILLNLLLNSIKFTPKGSVTLFVKKISSYQIQFSVQDTGIGMSPNQIKNLFHISNTHIQQNMSLLKDRSTGLPGIGLTVSNMICSEMKSQLTFESEQGKGSTFTFSMHAGQDQNLFVNGEQNQHSESSIPEEKFTTLISCENGNRIEKSYKRFFKSVFAIVVDDMDVNRLVLKAFLNRLGVKRIDEAPNGEECIKIFEKNVGKRIIIFMDLQMPVMDGIEASKKLKQNKLLGRNPFIVAVTAFASEVEKQKCFSVGINRFQDKPITLRNVKDSLIAFEEIISSSISSNY